MGLFNTCNKIVTIMQWCNVLNSRLLWCGRVVLIFVNIEILSKV